MIPAERIQHWATRLTPSDFGVSVIALGVGIALLWALLRSRRSLLRCLPGMVYLLLAAATVRAWPDLSSGMAWAHAGLIVAALCLHFRFFSRGEDGAERPRRRGAAPRRPPDYLPSIEDPFRAPLGEPEPATVVGPSPSNGWGRGWFLLMTIAAATVLLFDDLDGFAGTLLAWESPVAQHGFVPALGDGVGFARFLRERLLWDDGVLSAGHTSLFYGAPTYLILQWLGATPATLRLASVLATLLAMAVLFFFVRRHFGRGAATAATAFFALSTPVLFYGRYGSSIAGTVLAVLLAFAATWHFLERGRWIMLRAAVCGIALFAATLQYSPGRLAMLFLLAAIPLVLLVEFRRTQWSHWLGALLIAFMAWQVWVFQADNGRKSYFLHARGEHVLGFFRNPDTIKPLTGVDRQFEKGEITREQKLEVVRLLTAKTYREIIALISPDPRPRSRGAVLIYDPPPMSLYFAPLAVVLLLGLVRSLRSWRSWRHILPVLFALGYIAVLLFTNRIDAHRTALLQIPLAIWFGLGAREIGLMARRVLLPRPITWLLALLLAMAAGFSDILIRYGSSPRISSVIEAIAEEIDAIRGPVSLWFARDHRELSWLALRTLDKGLRSGETVGRVLPNAISDGLRQDKGGPAVLPLRQVTRIARQGTLLLGPRALFVETVQRLQAQGLRVTERNATGYSYYRIDGGESMTGIPDTELAPLALPTPRPTQSPLRLTAGRTVYLSDLPPQFVEFGFAEPRMNATWQGARVVMGGVEYEKAIGTHAWARIRFAVPADAFLFQAIVGLSDEMRACEAASIEFEVRGDGDALLWQSPLVDSLTPPLPVEFLVAGHSQVTLVTGDAGDDRDCDHGNWALAAFVLRDDTAPPAAR